jgi:hypothetical protein
MKLKKLEKKCPSKLNKELANLIADGTAERVHKNLKENKISFLKKKN